MQSLGLWKMFSHHQLWLMGAMRVLNVCTGKDLTNRSVEDGLEGEELKPGGLGGAIKEEKEVRCVEIA